MPKLAYLIAGLCLPATLSLAAAGGALTQTPQRSAADDLLCEIRATPVPGGVELEAVASGNRALTGSYSFTIEKSGPSGDSKIAQGGEFSLRRGAEQVLGSAGLGLAGADSYSARLVLTDTSGAVLCEAETAV